MSVISQLSNLKVSNPKVSNLAILSKVFNFEGQKCPSLSPLCCKQLFQPTEPCLWKCSYQKISQNESSFLGLAYGTIDHFEVPKETKNAILYSEQKFQI